SPSRLVSLPASTGSSPRRRGEIVLDETRSPSHPRTENEPLMKSFPDKSAFLSAMLLGFALQAFGDLGVGAKPLPGAEVIIDGSRQMLDEKWTYWEGPGFKSALPIKWRIVDDPVDKGTAVMSDDPAAAGGRYGAADI